MEYRYLEHIDNPTDLKQLPPEALPAVCEELRDFIIQELSHNPGHLASSLGAIELTVALHYVFDTKYLQAGASASTPTASSAVSPPSPLQKRANMMPSSPDMHQTAYPPHWA